MNSLKRFLTPMLSDHQTRPFPKAALVLIHIQENPNLKGKSDESDAILALFSSLTHFVSEKRSLKTSSLSSLNYEQQQPSGLGGVDEAASGDWSISDLVLVLSVTAKALIFIERHGPNAGNSTMKIRMDKTLRFWVDVAYENIKSDHPKLTKRQLIAQILHQYQERGDAMRHLDNQGKIAWKASPRFLTMLADAERDAQDDFEDFP